MWYLMNMETGGKAGHIIIHTPDILVKSSDREATAKGKFLLSMLSDI